MSVCRVNKSKNYTVMSNHHLKNKNLSLKAVGLLCKILSLPDDWNYTVSGLCSICKENETAIKSALDELKKEGYLKVTKIKPCIENGGRWTYEYDFYEQPLQKQAAEKQEVENLALENLAVENIPLYKQPNKSSTNKLNTNINNLGVPPKKAASPKISKAEKLAKANEDCLEKCLAELDEFPTAILDQLWKWKKSVDDHNSSMASRKITFSATALTQTLSQLADLKQSDAIRSITKAISKPEWGTIYTDKQSNYNANKKHDSAAYDMSDPAVLADLAATSARAKADKERLARLLEDFNE